MLKYIYVQGPGKGDVNENRRFLKIIIVVTRTLTCPLKYFIYHSPITFSSTFTCQCQRFPVYMQKGGKEFERNRKMKN